MAKMSQNVKEIIQVVVFVVAVVGLILVFVTYPLTRTKAYLARPDIATFKEDSTRANDVSAFLELDAAIDTFRVDADGLTDQEEGVLGTDPYKADTDNDLLSDYDEVKKTMTDPLNPDTDFDEKTDKLEAP